MRTTRFRGRSGDGDRIVIRRRVGWARETETVMIVFNDVAQPGMVLDVRRAKPHPLFQTPSAWYEIQVGPRSEDGATVCICNPAHFDASPLCGAIHAATVDFDGIELYFGSKEEC